MDGDPVTTQQQSYYTEDAKREHRKAVAHATAGSLVLLCIIALLVAVWLPEDLGGKVALSAVIVGMPSTLATFILTLIRWAP